MKSLTKDEKGVVTIEFALLLVLFVLPTSFAVARFGPAVIHWVQVTAANMEHNSTLQEENNRLLQKLLKEQSDGNASSPTTEPTPNPAQGCDPTPGATERPC